MNGYCDAGSRVIMRGIAERCWEPAVAELRTVTLDRAVYIDVELCEGHRAIPRIPGDPEHT